MSQTEFWLNFPFDRDRFFTVGELRRFEAGLRRTREHNPELGKFMRDPKWPAPEWMQLRKKELIPLMLFANHTGLADQDEFLLTAEGDPVDARVSPLRQHIKSAVHTGRACLGPGCRR